MFFFKVFIALKLIFQKIWWTEEGTLITYNNNLLMYVLSLYIIITVYHSHGHHNYIGVNDASLAVNLVTSLLFKILISWV